MNQPHDWVNELVHAEAPLKFEDAGKWRMIDIHYHKHQFRTWRDLLALIWGMDIWVQDIPVLKVFAMLQLILCFVLVLSRNR